MAELTAYGVEPTWVSLGDRDLATHLVRTQLLDAGYPLSEVTAALCTHCLAAVGVHYRSRCNTGVLDAWAMDITDRDAADRVRAAGIKPVVDDLIMCDPTATAYFIGYAVKSVLPG